MTYPQTGRCRASVRHARLLVRKAQYRFGCGQNVDRRLQLDALKAAGCERVFEEKASGAKRDRPELIAALSFMRTGDTWCGSSTA